jgi:hypothetical protein
MVEDAAFKKRNIADALESLRWGGAIVVERSRNQLRYRLSHADAWRPVIGEFPEVAPRWTWLLPAIAVLADGEKRTISLPSRVRDVELGKLVRDNARSIEGARLPSPPAPGPDIQFTEAFAEWFQHAVRELAQGRPLNP